MLEDCKTVLVVGRNYAADRPPLCSALDRAKIAAGTARDLKTPRGKIAFVLLSMVVWVLYSETFRISRAMTNDKLAAKLRQRVLTYIRTMTNEERPTMKYAFLFLIFLFPILAFAQAASLPVDIPVQDALGQLLSTLGGIKSATILGIVGLVLQATLLFFRTPLASFAGKWRLLIVAAVSLVAGVVTLVASGSPWLAALSHSATLASMQVLFHQFYVQFKKDET